MSEPTDARPGRAPRKIDDDVAPSARREGARERPKNGNGRTRGAPSGLVGAFVLVLGLLGALLWGSMLVAPWKLASGLLDARDHLRKAEKALSKTELKQARYYTYAAGGAVDRARDGLASGGPAFDLFAAIPTIDDALGEVPHLIAAADHSAKAALGTLNVAQDSLRGPRSVIIPDPDDPKGGKKIDIDRLRDLIATVSDVRAEIEASQAELEAVDLDKLPQRAHDGIKDAIEKAEDADKTIRKAESGLSILPAILGADGPRTYMMGFQNTAEQRGTGGAILRFSFLQISDGSPVFEKKTSTVYDVDRNRQQITIPLDPDDWYVANIADAQRFGNANWSPDFPSSAELTLRYAQATPTAIEFPEINGVIVIDPIASQKLMPGVGPYRTKAGNRISQRKLVNFLLYRAYGVQPIPAKRRILLNQIVEGFYDGLFDPLHPTELLGGFGDALSQKHIQIWMTDPAEQAFIEKMGWDGAITPRDELRKDDYVYVVEQNVGGSKLDYFSSPQNSMDISFEGKDAIVSTEVRARNSVFLPQPRYSMGDAQTHAACAAGRCPLHRPMFNLYVRDDAELISAGWEGDDGVSRIDAPPTVATWTGETPPMHFEHGKRVWSGTLQIPPGAEGALRFDYRVPGVLQTRNGRTVYRLHVQHQPKVQPETLTIRLTLPEGAEAVKIPQGWERDGDQLVWEHILKTDTILEVSWRK